MSDSFVFTEILPLNSIVNPNTLSRDYLDLQDPFSFFDFIKYTKYELSPLQYNTLYISYINKWGEVKNNTKNQINQTIQDRYIELIKEITIKYTTSEEKRFISNIDYDDETELDVILPFFSKKISEICDFLSEKREKLKFKIEKNKIKGTDSSIEKSIFETITDVIFTDKLEISTYQNVINESILLKDLNIEVEELYDIYTNYLDNDTTKSYDVYDTKTELRKKLYTSNINKIDANIFINIDQAISNQIFNKVYVFLNEFKKNFTINYDINKVILNCKPDDKLFTLINENKIKATRLVTLRHKLIRKYIGCDFYYIITGNDVSDITEDILFKADNPSGNLLNRHFPTTASIEEESKLQSCRRIGLFFTPEKNSILYFSVPEKKYKVDSTKLEPNKLYIFPDPNLYGNTIGLTRNYDKEYPLIHITNYSKSVHNQSYCYAEGDINSNPYTQDFYAYFSRNQLKESFFFGKEGLQSNFSSLYDKGIITKWATDIYGNQFALFKEKTKRNLVNNTISDDSIEYVYEDYYGGPITFSSGEILPEEILASNIYWVTPNVWASDYYYNILIEAGIGAIINGIMERGMFWEGYSIDGLVIDRTNKLGSNIFDIRFNDLIEHTFIEIDGDLFSNVPAITMDWDMNPNEGLTSSYTYIVDDLFYVRNPSNIGTKLNRTLDGIPAISDKFSKYTPHLYYEYVLSSIKFKEFEGGPLVSETFEQFDFNERSNFIVNQVSENKKTILADTVNEININPYKLRNSSGIIYTKNIVTGDVLELSASLQEQLINKYTNIKNELYVNVLDFNIYNNFIWLKTENYYIFEKLLYQENKYIYSGTGENYIKYTKETDFLINSTNPFIFENKDFCIIVVLSGKNLTNKSYTVIPYIYKIDYNTCNIKLIYPLVIDEKLIKLFTNDTSVNVTKIRKIGKSVLTYNSRNNKYAILATLEDQNEFVFLYKIFFDYNEDVISNITPIIFDVFAKTPNDPNNSTVIISDVDPNDFKDLDLPGVTVSDDGTITFV